jgi:hypothetical protein
MLAQVTKHTNGWGVATRIYEPNARPYVMILLQVCATITMALDSNMQV